MVGLVEAPTQPVPSPAYKEIPVEVSPYKLRINPLERREDRFNDNIPGLQEGMDVDVQIEKKTVQAMFGDSKTLLLWDCELSLVYSSSLFPRFVPTPTVRATTPVYPQSHVRYPCCP